jgi:nickel superoxide dismutase
MKKYRYNILAFTVIASALFAFSTNAAHSHCEIPCGIYDDSLRFQMLKEDIKTIEKSINQITELSKSPSSTPNQFIRWINNKEVHADKVQDLVAQYFLTQRIKPVESKDAEAYKNYQKQLELLHNILILAMKCKQTTDLEMSKKLLETVEAFEKIYFHKY